MVKVIFAPPEQYASEIMHSTGRNPMDHENCVCFTDVTTQAQAQAQAQADDTTTEEVRHV